MIAILLMLAAQDQTPTAIDAAHRAYDSCVAEQALALGARNHETADTILTAVRSRCDSQWSHLVVTFPGNDLGGSAAELHDSVLAHWRTQAEGAAIAALLEARAKSP